MERGLDLLHTGKLQDAGFARENASLRRFNRDVTGNW